MVRPVIIGVFALVCILVLTETEGRSVNNGTCAAEKDLDSHFTHKDHNHEGSDEDDQLFVEDTKNLEGRGTTYYTNVPSSSGTKGTTQSGGTGKSNSNQGAKQPGKGRDDYRDWNYRETPTEEPDYGGRCGGAGGGGGNGGGGGGGKGGWRGNGRGGGNRGNGRGNRPGNGNQVWQNRRSQQGDFEFDPSEKNPATSETPNVNPK